MKTETQAPAEAPEIGEVTWQQAADAIEDLDDFARMMVGVDPTGPRETLYRFLEQAKAALTSKAQPKGIMPGREWLEGMVDVWRVNAAESSGDVADAFRTCADDLERALKLNPREALPSPAPAHDATDERASFEAWASRNGYYTKRAAANPERYHAWLTNALWDGWSGRAISAPAVGAGDTARLDWLERQKSVALTLLRISAKPEATRYWCIEDRDDEDLTDGIEPEDRQTLRAAIDAVMASQPPVQGSES